MDEPKRIGARLRSGEFCLRPAKSAASTNLPWTVPSARLGLGQPLVVVELFEFEAEGAVHHGVELRWRVTRPIWRKISPAGGEPRHGGSCG